MSERGVKAMTKDEIAALRFQLTGVGTAVGDATESYPKIERLLRVAEDHARLVEERGQRAGGMAVSKNVWMDLRVQLDEAWRALGTTESEAQDDPDTQRLSQCIEIALQYERDKQYQLQELLDEAKREVERLKESGQQWIENYHHEARTMRDALAAIASPTDTGEGM